MDTSNNQYIQILKFKAIVKSENYATKFIYLCFWEYHFLKCGVKEVRKLIDIKIYFLNMTTNAHTENSDRSHYRLGITPDLPNKCVLTTHPTARN